MDEYTATFSGAEMDLLLGFDPEVNPNASLEQKLTEYRRWAATVQSIVDDAVVSW